jgi:hypothetical protein
MMRIKKTTPKIMRNVFTGDYRVIVCGYGEGNLENLCLYRLK